MKIREYCYIENRKVVENVQDWLVREYYDVSNASFEDIETYLKREIEKLEDLEEQGLVETFLKNFFETIIKENITVRKYWVEYLDIHMEERYVEDGEFLYEYESDYWAPVAIRGSEEEVELFIKKLLDEVGFKFEDLDLDLSELEDEFECDDYEEEGGSIDRAYYEQRSRNFTL